MQKLLSTKEIASITKRLGTCEPLRVQERLKWVSLGHEILVRNVMKWDRGHTTKMKEVWSKYNHVHMEIWNLKSGHNMYPDFEVKFRAIPDVIFWACYILSRSLGSQKSNASSGVQIEAKTKKLWPFEDNYAELKNHFEIILKFNLWIQNSFQNDPNFEIAHCHIDVLPLLIRNCILGTPLP